MGSRNGKAAVIDAVMERFDDARKSVNVNDIDLSKRLEKLLDFVEENGTALGGAIKRVARDAAVEGGEVAGTAAGAVGGAAEAGVHAAADAVEALARGVEEEVLKPTMRYGRGVRHGLLIGAAIAILYTPWPGAMVREKIKSLVREGADMIEAFREGAADAAEGGA